MLINIDKNMVKNIYKNIIFFSIIMAIFFIVSEMVYRICAIPETGTVSYKYNSSIGFMLTPNTTTRYKIADVDNIVKTNRYGLHDEEYSLSKPLNEKRILFLGDSYVESLQVQIPDMFTKIIQKSLNEYCKNKILCINAGKSGWGTMHEHLYMNLYGFLFQPDVVVQSFVMNDVSDDWRDKDQIAFDYYKSPLFIIEKETGSTNNIIPPTIKGVLYKFYDYSKFAGFIHLKLGIAYDRVTERKPNRKKIKEEYPIGFDILKEPYNDKIKDAWKITLNSIRNLYQKCRNKGIDYFLVIIPAESQFNTRKTATTEFWDIPSEKITDKPQEILRQLAEEEGFHCIDLLPKFKQVGNVNLHFQEGHWNQLGHKYAARYIEQSIKERI